MQSFWSFPDFSEFFLYPWSSPVFFHSFPIFQSLRARSKSSDDNQTIRGQQLHWRDGFGIFGRFSMGNFSIKTEKFPWNPRETWRVSKSCDWFLEVWTIWIDLTWLTFVKRVCRCCFSVWLPCIGRREVPSCSPQERHIREKYGWIRLLGLSCYIGRVCIKCVCSGKSHFRISLK
jgi:hypothetical protein